MIDRAMDGESRPAAEAPRRRRRVRATARRDQPAPAPADLATPAPADQPTPAPADLATPSPADLAVLTTPIQDVPGVARGADLRGAGPETVRAVADVAAGETGEDREVERGLRGLIGGGSSQVSVAAAMRARDATRPSAEDLAGAEANLIIIRRGWTPPEARQ